jgi:hypothetical protein
MIMITVMVMVMGVGMITGNMEQQGGAQYGMDIEVLQPI